MNMIAAEKKTIFGEIPDKCDGAFESSSKIQPPNETNQPMNMKRTWNKSNYIQYSNIYWNRTLFVVAQTAAAVVIIFIG